jgi:hypothetical protein
MKNEEIENRFIYHAPSRGAALLHQQVTTETLALAKRLNHILPESRGKACAMTALEECRMWANQSIATNHDKLVPAIPENPTFEEIMAEEPEEGEPLAEPA